MVTKKSLYFKTGVLCGLVLIIMILQIIIMPTISKLRDVHIDEVRGYYTSLFYNHDGEGNAIALEPLYSGETIVGYNGTFSIHFSNFNEEGITQRDITYKIYTKEIEEDNGNYFVEGVWGRHISVKKDTNKYDINILNEGSTKETADEKELISYATNNPDGNPTGATNLHIIELTRKPEYSVWDPSVQYEEVTIIIELINPYREIIVFNVRTSPRLIVYNVVELKKFNRTVNRLFIQTANTWDRITSGEKSYAPDAFRVVFHWINQSFDNTFNTIIKHTNNNRPVDPAKINTPCLITPQEITYQKTLQMYIPAGSEFYIDFYPTGGEFKLYAYAELKNNASYPLEPDLVYSAYTEYNHNVAIVTDINVMIGNEEKNQIMAYLIE